MRRAHSFLALALAAALAGVACNTKSPTAPPPSPTPSSYSISLTPSSSSAEVGTAILLTAKVTSGSQNVPDNTSVTFRLTGCVAGGASDPSFENGACEVTRTTSSGVATAAVFSKAATGTYEVQVNLPNTQVKILVRFFNPTNPRTLAIYSIVPNQGQWTGNEPVTIQGRGFATPVTVDFIVNGETRHAAVVSVANDGSSVQVITPNTQFIQQPSVAADVKVTAAAGTQNAVTDTLTSGFLYLFPVTPAGGDPLIYAVVPAYGSVAGGETVTIYGANFAQPVKVKFGAEDVQVLSVSTDQGTLTLLTPKHSGNPGTVDVTVTTGAATQKSVTRAQGWTWVPAGGNPPPGDPQIYSIVPSSGLVTGGDTVTIYGANFSKPLTVTFGAENVQVLSVSNDLAALTVLTSKHTGAAPQTVDVTVTIWTGKAVTRAAGWTWLPVTSNPSLPVIYPPLIPSKGSPRGGETVTILGANLCGQVDTVTGKCIAAPTVTFTPTSGGYGVRSVSVLSYAQDGKSIQIQTPQLSPDSVLTDVSVTVGIVNPAGSATLANGFTYVGENAPPIIYYLQPNQGSARGGDDVTIFGRYFLKPVRVTFSAGSGDAQVVSVADDGTSVTIKTPPSTLQPLLKDTASDVTVITQSGTGRDQPVTIAQGFLYLAEAPTPEVYSLSPNAGPLEGGTRVTITGKGFQTPVQVQFNDRQAQVISSNFNQVVCLSPSITATQPTGSAIYQVKVINVNTGFFSNTLPFRYGDAMFISSISPNLGPDTGGTVVTVFGQGFVAPVAVALGGLPATVLSVSGTELVVKSAGVLHRSCVDQSAPTTVTNIDSNVTATGPTFTYVAAVPLITSVTVSGGALGGGSNLIPEPGTGCTDSSYSHSSPWSVYTATVNGVNFEPGMRAVFASPAVEVPTTFVSSTQVQFTVPDLSAVQLTKVACTLPDGTTQGQRSVPTAIDLTIRNFFTNCSNTLKGALVIQPCAVDCQGTLPPITMTLTPVTASIAGGTSITYAVSLSRPAATAGNIQIVISPSGAGVIASATSVLVPIAAGQQTVTFSVTAGANPGTATIIATYSGASATATLTVTTAVTGIIFTPGAINLSPGGSATLGISINPPSGAPTTVTVNLIGPAGVVSVPVFPVTVTVPAGGSGTLSVTAGATGGTVTLQGTSGGLTPGSATVTVIAPAVTLTITPATQTLAPTQTASLNVSISPPPSAPATVNLTLAGPSGILSAPVFPTTVSVPISGTTTLAITAGAATGTVTINGSYGAAAASAQVTVQTTPLTLSLTPSSQTLAVGTTANFIASINTAQPVPVDVFITQTGPNGVISFTGLAGAPPRVTIPAGQAFTNFTVNGLTVGGPVTITGTLPPAYGGGIATSSVTVNAFTITLAPNPLNLGVGASINMTVTLNNPAPTTTAVTLTSANPAIATVPASVTIAAGATSATAVVTGVAIGTTTITAGPVASLNNAQATATVTVTNFTITLAPNPMNLGVGATTNLTITLNLPAPATTAVSLTSANPAIATVPASVTFAVGATTATAVVTGVAPGTTTITAGPVPSLNNAQATSTVTVTPYTITLTPNPMTIALGTATTQNLTITFNQPVPATTVVNLTSANPAVASVPASVTFSVGATTATAVVTGVAPGTTTITAGPVPSLNNAQATSTVTVTP
jgi:trimeric autotransporter adhesin